MSDDRDFADMLNGLREGLNETLGMTFVRATTEEVVARIEIGPEHLQPYGLVHGGVYCAMIETLASSAAAIHVLREGRHTVGLENSTSFLRGVRGGTITGTATPLSLGRRSHVWEVAIRDAEERLVASGRVRMIVLDAGSDVGGEQVALKSGGGADPA